VLSPIATELTYQFRQSNGRRELQQDARLVVEQLDRRGYRLGIISNVISTSEIPDWLESDGFSGYFKSVVLSSVLGRRKPDPAVYREAARQIGVAPAKCAYVGDNPARTSSARAMPDSMVILLMDPAEVERTLQLHSKPDVIYINLNSY
jgi:HAD superfamily hydrolase (TIGR01549 family)